MNTDFFILQKIKNGDDNAINVFVHKYYPMILKYCRLHLKDSDYAEDLTQETFEKFFSSIDSYQEYGKISNYLYVIAANKCKDFYRKKKEIVMDEMPEQMDDSMEHIAVKMDIHRMLEAMPEELKEISILFFFQELKQKEIAKILGIGVPLVKYRCRKAREWMQKYLKGDGLACS